MELNLLLLIFENIDRNELKLLNDVSTYLT